MRYYWYKSNLWVAVYHYIYIIIYIYIYIYTSYIYIYIHIPEEQSYSFHRPLEGHNPAIFQVMNAGASDLKRKHDVFVRGLTNFKVSAGVCPLGDDGARRASALRQDVLAMGQAFLDITDRWIQSCPQARAASTTSAKL